MFTLWQKKQKKQTKKKTWGAYVPTYLRGTSKKITRRELITKRERERKGVILIVLTVHVYCLYQPMKTM